MKVRNEFYKLIGEEFIKKHSTGIKIDSEGMHIKFEEDESLNEQIKDLQNYVDYLEKENYELQQRLKAVNGYKDILIDNLDKCFKIDD